MKVQILPSLTVMTVILLLGFCAHAEISQDPESPNEVRITGAEAKKLNAILNKNLDASIQRAHLLGKDEGIMVEDVTVGNVMCERNIKVDPRAKDPHKLDGKVTCSISLGDSAS